MAAPLDRHRPLSAEMYCVESPHRSEELIKRSRFIGIIAPCHDESGAARLLARLHAEYADASHIAFAYRIKSRRGIVARVFDAGEPSGTAGKPIFQQLEGKDLINVLIAVVRYFGGIKLGAGGLARAYGGTAKKVIEGSSVIQHVEYKTIELSLDYSQLQPLEYWLRKRKGQIIEQSFSDKVDLVIRLPADRADEVTTLFSRQHTLR
jgi:uncharacterized YigZ family protein